MTELPVIVSVPVTVRVVACWITSNAVFTAPGAYVRFANVPPPLIVDVPFD